MEWNGIDTSILLSVGKYALIHPISTGRLPLHALEMALKLGADFFPRKRTNLARFLTSGSM